LLNGLRLYQAAVCSDCRMDGVVYADSTRHRMMELPAKKWIAPMFPRHWQVTNTAAAYTVLLNMLISGNHLFLLLRTESTAAVDFWLVRITDGDCNLRL
jgi:hypothetical protein